MPPEIHGTAIALRLGLTVIAGAALGMDRSRNGHSAGLRTTLLVPLAASVAPGSRTLSRPLGLHRSLSGRTASAHLL